MDVLETLGDISIEVWAGGNRGNDGRARSDQVLGRFEILLGISSKICTCECCWLVPPTQRFRIMHNYIVPQRQSKVGNDIGERRCQCRALLWRCGAKYGEFINTDRKSVVQGTRVSVRVELGGRRNIQKKINIPNTFNFKPSRKQYIPIDNLSSTN